MNYLKPKWILKLFVCLIPLAAVAEQKSYDQQTVSAFVERQKDLQASIKNYCTESSGSIPISELTAAMQSWFLVQGLVLPAFEFIETDYRFVFWPDSKDGLRKQVQAAFAQDVKSVDWQTQPASVTTLSAIEFAFASDDPKAHCDWLIAVSDIQVQRASELLEAHAFYQMNTTENLRALYTSALYFNVQLDSMLFRKDHIIWQLGPAWRSESTWTIQQAMFRQVQALLALFDSEVPETRQWQDKLAAFNDIGDSPDYATLTALNEQVQALASFVAADMAPALDVPMGFNNFDGD